MVCDATVSRFLAREGDDAGIINWTNALTSNQLDRVGVTKAFFDSDEFQTLYAPLSRLYFAYFGRAPDYNGLLGWVTNRQANMSLEAVSQHFASSLEFTQKYGNVSDSQFVFLCYQNVLGRTPDAPGFNFWLKELHDGNLNRGQVMLRFSESSEFKFASYNKLAVTMSYIGTLRRSPETNGFEFWLKLLNEGANVNEILAGFIGSQEYRNRFLPSQ